MPHAAPPPVPPTEAAFSLWPWVQRSAEGCREEQGGRDRGRQRGRERRALHRRARPRRRDADRSPRDGGHAAGEGAGHGGGGTALAQGRAYDRSLRPLRGEGLRRRGHDRRLPAEARHVALGSLEGQRRDREACRRGGEAARAERDRGGGDESSGPASSTARASARFSRRSWASRARTSRPWCWAATAIRWCR